jgi:tRNA(adenine34) deaminase
MDNRFMEIAIKEAKKAYDNEDIPVGVVLVKDGKVLAKAYNKKNKLKDPTCHAEILAIKKACRRLGDFRLEDVEVYVTKEPCIMCYGALLSARVKTVYFGAYDKKYSILDLKDNFVFNHSIELIGGVLENKCSELLSSFFEKLRSDKNANRNSKENRN